MKVILHPRHSTVTVKSQIVEMGKEEINFLMKLESEVKANPKKSKKLRKQIIATHAMCVSLFALITPVSAASGGVDPDLLQTLVIIMGTCVVLAAAAAVIALMAAGVWKMFFGEKDASDWTTNIIKGIIQVFSAPVIVALIAGIFTLMFSHLPAFIPILTPLRAWYGG